jgi:hypothetical protein
MPDLPELVEGYAYSVLSSDDAFPEALFWSSVSTNSWPAINKAIFIPFALEEPVTVYQMGYGSSSGSPGSLDMGIYSVADRSRIVSTGLFAPAATTSSKVQDIADTYLTPGYYYLAMVTSNTSNGITSRTPDFRTLATFGVKECLNAAPLPSGISAGNLVPASSSYFPIISLHFKTFA